MRDWTKMPLGEAVDVRMGRQRSPKNANGDNMVPYLRAANVKDGALDLTDVKAMNFDPREQATFALVPGDVLVTEGCGSLDQLGASARWNSEVDGVVCFQNTLLRLRARDGVTLPAYVYALARWLFWTAQWAEVSSGTNIFHIGSRRAAALLVPVPPLEVQRRVVDLINHIDRAVESAQICYVAASVSLDSLQDELEASSEVALGDVAEVRSGPSWKAKDESATPSTGSRPVLKITNTRADGTIDLDELAYVSNLPPSTMTLTPRSLVVIRTNGNRDRIGNVYMPPPETEGFAVSAFQMILEVDDHYDRELLYHYLAAPKIQTLMSDSASGTTGLGNLAVRWLRKLPVPDPASAERSTKLSQVLRTVVAAGSYLDQLTRTRKALLNGLMSGAHTIPDPYDRFVAEATAA